jgi:signal transduction histidine kinase
MWGVLALFLLVGLFTALAIYVEYWEFDRESQRLRHRYLEEQKQRIRYDTERVLHFIESEYRKRRGSVDDTLLKAQILNAIETLYGRPDGTGYIFIYGFDGTCLSDPIQRHNVGKNLYGFRDPDGVQVIRELIEASRRPEGGYVHYTWIKPTTRERSPKISYARAFLPWQWMVGTGVYLDEIDRVIAQRRQALQEKTRGSIFKILALMGMLFVVGLAGGVFHQLFRLQEVGVDVGARGQLNAGRLEVLFCHDSTASFLHRPENTMDGGESMSGILSGRGYPWCVRGGWFFSGALPRVGPRGR